MQLVELRGRHENQGWVGLSPYTKPGFGLRSSNYMSRPKDVTWGRPITGAGRFWLPLQVNKCTFFQYILCAMFDVDILYGWMTLSLSKLPNGPGSLFITFYKSTLLTSSYVKLGDKSSLEAQINQP